MIALGALWLLLGAAPTPRSTQAVVPADTNPPITLVPAVDSGRLASGDTVPRRRRHRTVDVSEWYSRRLTIHRYVAFATLPVFAFQYAAGEQLFAKSREAPVWAKTGHRVGATLLAGMFTVNTVTGLWNLWDARSVPDKRVLRTVHALTMLTADAGFTWAGARLSNEAETSLQKRREHRTVALSCMGLTMASAGMMKLFNH